MNTVSRGLAVIALAVAGFGAGYLVKGNGRQRAVAVSTASAQAPSDVFVQCYQDIVTHYVGDTDPKNLTYSAMEGLISSLGDPHTLFMRPKFAAEFTKETRGENAFSGIGARLLPDVQGVRIMRVFNESPASKAGVKPGDIITHVDGTAIGGMEVDAIVKRIKGVAGTTVKLTVSRPSTNESIVLEAKRARINVPTADGYVLQPSQVGYVQISTFSETTTAQFDDVIESFKSANIRGLIIDLRSNPGGLLDTARDLLSRFVSNKTVVTTTGRGGQIEEVDTDGQSRRDWPYPIVILVNEDSASASEIFSGVMHDYRLATLIGEHTYGKASVQKLFPLSDGSFAKITIAKYSLPSGVDMRRKVDDEGQYVSGGLKPDVEVPLSLGPKTIVGDPATDNQIRKGIETIESLRHPKS